MTVGVDGAEELPELGFMCGCLELLENGSADMMRFFGYYFLSTG